MTIAQMKDYFLILQDKYGSPYYTDAEIETFINRGQIDEVIALLPTDGGEINIELNQNTIMRITPLLFSTVQTMNGSTGKVLRTTLDTAVSGSVLRVLSIGWEDSRPVKYTRHNNWFSYIANAFKNPTAESPRVKEAADSWIFKPLDATVDIEFTGVRYPVPVSISTPTNCELPDLFHNEIVANALEKAGVGSRDQMLLELQQLTKK